MNKAEVEPRFIIKALASLLIEKKIITGAELREVLDAVIQHEIEVLDAVIQHEQEKGDENLK